MTSPQTRAAESSDLELGSPFTCSLTLHLVVQNHILAQGWKEHARQACESKMGLSARVGYEQEQEAWNSKAHWAVSSKHWILLWKCPSPKHCYHCHSWEQMKTYDGISTYCYQIKSQSNSDPTIVLNILSGYISLQNFRWHSNKSKRVFIHLQINSSTPSCAFEVHLWCLRYCTKQKIQGPSHGCL